MATVYAEGCYLLHEGPVLHEFQKCEDNFGFVVCTVPIWTGVKTLEIMQKVIKKYTNRNNLLKGPSEIGVINIDKR